MTLWRIHNVDRKVWKQYICERVQGVGREVWNNGFNETETKKEDMHMKIWPMNESFGDGSAGVRVRLIVRGGCLTVVGPQIETEEHVLNAIDMEKSEEDGDG